MNWITSGKENDKNNLLPPELFRRKLTVKAELSHAELTATAMGIYEAAINGKKVSDCYFAPGYTHYESYIQAQTYDVTALLKPGENTLDITVANGWWLGTLGNKNNRYGKVRGLAAELVIAYFDGTTETIGTDESWTVTHDTPSCFADFYNGEVINLTRADESQWKLAPVKGLAGKLPEIKPHFGAFVREDCRLKAKALRPAIYDFGQNHAGVIHLVAEAKKGTVIYVRHAEILNQNGELFTKNLRKAKATLILTCGQDGINEFLPRFTYMGFRYAQVTANAPIEIKTIESIVLTSDCEPIGTFSCSNPLLNRLQENIQWGQRSNFMDIPTDCPQRDERMGWTGDIAVFAQTAAFNRNIHDFMAKWLTDLRLYQRRNGSIPVTIPENPTYNPSPFKIPIAIWGDSSTMVPWAVYRAYGDKDLLAMQYDSMKAYVDSELRIAMKPSFLRHKKYLWDVNPFQYGDWCAPGEGCMKWLAKGRYLSTSFMANSIRILIDSANLLGKLEDAMHYSEILEKVKEAFANCFIKPNGQLMGDFQSNYACALYFDMIPEDKKAACATRLAQLVRDNDYKIATGFAGTPYILFALADNGYIEEAYKLLLNEACPSWLFTVKAGGTTTWERWDALNEDGSIRADALPNMVSFNHYAYGAVGDFFYRRILGLEPTTPGYKTFAVKVIPGGGLTHAEGSLKTDFGTISIRWEQTDAFVLNLTVPEGTTCEVTLPGKKTVTVTSGTYEWR